MAEIDVLFHELVKRGASDLHLTANCKPMIRESGHLVDIGIPVLPEEEVRRVLYEIMPERNRLQFEETNDTDFGYEIPGLVRLRANIFRDRLGIGGVFRAIPARILSAEQLNLPDGVKNLCHLSKGLVVVTGPTGSGKSTTLAALIDLINRTRRDHIITIEDPIEFVHEPKLCKITQREVHTHTQSFAAALRAALRQDPDIVLVGEMRDLETIEIAIETAETGHLVFGTLHTTTAASTVDRIIDAFPADRQNQIRAMLANSLKGVVAQTLCRRRKGGRIAALEVLLVDWNVSALIRDSRVHQIPSAMQTGRGRGMMTLNDSLVDLVAGDVVDMAEAFRLSVVKDEFVAMLRKRGLSTAGLPGVPQEPAAGGGKA